jgi:hypothetical protein
MSSPAKVSPWIQPRLRLLWNGLRRQVSQKGVVLWVSRILATVVEGFSKIASPITELQKKNKKFVWTKKCAEAFRRLKELLTTTPILRVPARDIDFLVCTDASKEGLGGVLMQDGQVIAYFSRKLRRHEENYATRDLELLAIVYALKVWRHYLVGRKFELKMDHCGLQHFFAKRPERVTTALVGSRGFYRTKHYDGTMI